MFVDVGRIDGEDEVKWGEGSSETKPDAYSIKYAFIEMGYRTIEEPEIWFDDMQGFWRFSSKVVEIKQGDVKF